MAESSHVAEAVNVGRGPNALGNGAVSVSRSRNPAVTAVRDLPPDADQSLTRESDAAQKTFLRYILKT